MVVILVVQCLKLPTSQTSHLQPKGHSLARAIQSTQAVSPQLHIVLLYKRLTDVHSVLGHCTCLSSLRRQWLTPLTR